MPSTAQQIVNSVYEDDPSLSKAEAEQIAWQKLEGEPEKRHELAKSSAAGSVERVGFEARVEGSVGALYKSDDDYVIWGPASVEVVDKENDRIEASALEEALPQLMKRQSLSYEHSDQIVGEILDKFETDEPVEVQFGDTTVKRQEFPTDVLNEDGMEAPALFVAGNVYNDTQKARDVREAIDKGDIDSYSISGEAIVSSMSIEGGEPVTDISKIDLSAVTLCETGMNQMAKFGVVKKSFGENGQARSLSFAKSEGSDATLNQNQAEELLKTEIMGDPLTKDGMEDILGKHLPDGELATVEDVESIAKEQAEQVLKENATNTEDETEGSTERPNGDDSSPVEQDNEYSGDADKNPAEESDKVEEKSAGFTKDELKAKLPDDQFKAIEPLLDEEAEEVEPDSEPSPEPEPEPEPSPEEDEPLMDEEEEMVEEKAKSLGLDPDDLTNEQKQAIAKADPSGLEKAAGPSGVSTNEELKSALDADEDDIEKSIEEAEGTTMAGSAFFDGDGGVKL